MKIKNKKRKIKLKALKIKFYFPKEKMMFTGDFLFKGTIGRTDFYNSDTELMLESLKKISTVGLNN